MGQNVVPFDFEGNAVRVIDQDGEPWWVLADVCAVLEIAQPHHAAARLDDDEKGRAIVTTLGGPQEMTIINESGLWSLVLTSRKPSAKRFKKWITAEVIPAIRKTGSYGAAPAADPMAVLSDPAAMRGLLLTYTEKVLELEAKVQEQAPTVEAFDRIANADGSMSITEAAKALQLQRIKDLSAWMHAQKWIYRRSGNKNWLAHQDKLRAGLLEHKVAVVPDRVNGGDRVVESVRVTPAGLAHLAKKLGGSPSAGHTQH